VPGLATGGTRPDNRIREQAALIPPPPQLPVSGVNLPSSRSFVRDESGVETLEYAILVGLIVGATVAVIGAVGVWVFNQFDSLPHA
jgi:Flp pilus assembly pilin Flp